MHELLLGLIATLCGIAGTCFYFSRQYGKMSEEWGRISQAWNEIGQEWETIYKFKKEKL